MKIYILPKTRLGKASVFLAAAGILITAVSMVTVARGDQGPGTVLQLTGAVSSLLSIAAFLTGIISIIWSKERAILVYLGMVFLALIFILGEFLFPH